MNLKNPTTVMVVITLTYWDQGNESYSGITSQTIQVLLHSKTEEERTGELVAKMTQMEDAFYNQGVTMTWAEVPGWIQ